MVIEQGTVFRHRKGGHYVFEGVGLPRKEIIVKQLEHNMEDDMKILLSQLKRSFTMAKHTETGEEVLVHRRESFGSDTFYTDSDTHLVLYWRRFDEGDPVLYARPLAMFFDYVGGQPRFEHLPVTDRRRFFSLGLEPYKGSSGEL